MFKKRNGRSLDGRIKGRNAKGIQLGKVGPGRQRQRADVSILLFWTGDFVYDANPRDNRQASPQALLTKISTVSVFSARLLSSLAPDCPL